MTTSTIIRTAVSEQKRLGSAVKFFGAKFPLKVEPYIYAIAGMLVPAYNGGYWEFFELADQSDPNRVGFLMCPALDGKPVLRCPTQLVGPVSTDALGIVACLYAYSHLSFAKDDKLSRECTRHYHLLRDYALQHAESALIMRAID